MKNTRIYGKSPYNIVVVHGGPGGPGQMAPVAKRLAKTKGVIEALQTKDSIKGQTSELKSIINRKANAPVTLIGHSWGAMLCCILAAQNPGLIRKLILISCPPLEHKGSKITAFNRFKRLNPTQRKKLHDLLHKLDDPNCTKKDKIFAQLGRQTLKTDCYEMISSTDDVIAYQHHIFEKVWKEAEGLRLNGKFLKIAAKIATPVLIIHGDCDPHPFASVRRTFKGAVGEVEFELLGRCGHYPWLERHARDKFFLVLKDAL